MTRQLTKRQSAILQYVAANIREKGFPPTIAEIGAQFAIASTNGVNDHLVALERKGYIRRSSKARSIQVTDKAALDLYRDHVGTLPLVGRIAAGTPLLASENIEDEVAVDPALVKDRSYCLRVQGDSMIEDGILDGDIIVVDQDKEASPGSVVVALVGEEATVKHFHPHDNLIELRPANATLRSLFFDPDEVRLQGVVVALQRTLE